MKIEMCITFMDKRTYVRRFDTQDEYDQALLNIQQDGVRESDGAAKQYWRPFHAVLLIERRLV